MEIYSSHSPRLTPGGVHHLCFRMHYMSTKSLQTYSLANIIYSNIIYDQKKATYVTIFRPRLRYYSGLYDCWVCCFIMMRSFLPYISLADFTVRFASFQLCRRNITMIVIGGLMFVWNCCYYDFCGVFDVQESQTINLRCYT